MCPFPPNTLMPAKDLLRLKEWLLHISFSPVTKLGNAPLLTRAHAGSGSIVHFLGPFPCRYSAERKEAKSSYQDSLYSLLSCVHRQEFCLILDNLEKNQRSSRQCAIRVEWG